MPCCYDSYSNLQIVKLKKPLYCGTFCSILGYPCAKMPCFNDAQCENINRKQFKCTCRSGFSGPTCENVGKNDNFIYAYTVNLINGCPLQTLSQQNTIVGNLFSLKVNYGSR